MVELKMNLYNIVVQLIISLLSICEILLGIGLEEKSPRKNLLLKKLCRRNWQPFLESFKCPISLVLCNIGYMTFILVSSVRFSWLVSSFRTICWSLVDLKDLEYNPAMCLNPML